MTALYYLDITTLVRGQGIIHQGHLLYLFIGNLHQIPSKKRYFQFEKWALEYGPIYSLILGTKVMIVLNSDVAIKELRPEAYIAQDILSGGLRIHFMPNHGAWTVARKLARRILGVSAARTYSSGDFINHLRRYTASITTLMTFGFRTTTMDDPRFKVAFDVSALLDLVPVLRCLPELFFPIKKEGRKIHGRELRLFRDLFLKTKEGLRKGTAKIRKDEKFSDDFAAYIGGSLLQAGSEATASILVGFVQAMVIFPDVAKAAQAELDRVCGDRMPGLNDFPNLPVTQDDMYMGYHIPKSSTIIMNVWAVHNDPQRHPDPRRFDPMRYIDDHQTSIEAANNPEATKRDHFVLVAGRRRCQGMHITDRSIFLAISRLLWAFNFHRAVDRETSEVIIPDINDMADGIMMLPKSFPADIRPRSASKAEYVKQEWSQMLKMLDEQRQWKEIPEGFIWKEEQLSEINVDA
ncbi:cytochrome P450 [Bimuria novae-zelandiae CBS 107.79]|uniref:Cytochrome P450 n=1 Tax=Bimuria novae-zelandiae CBS 107.79 TaxID=1447943 RepID=A0A6A5UWN3_9PLEO|nr:cytochrome P450 [Bimuria novae-zelandiae CBS 107.79]